jgi:signal transduction histidine kinase
LDAGVIALSALAALASSALAVLAIASRRSALRARTEEHLRHEADANLARFQAREALLAAVVDDASVATLVLDERGAVQFASLAAKELFFEGKEVSAVSLPELLPNAPEALRRALAADRTELFALERDGERDVFYVTKRAYSAQAGGPVRTIVTMHRLTDELLREELLAYKKLVRVLGHELNNTLAPVASLAGSAQKLVADAEYDELPAILRTVGERVEHLRTFLQQYARVARLPKPRCRDVPLAPVLTRLSRLFPGVETIAGEDVAYCDEGQIEQLLVNLVKNALEAESDVANVTIRVTPLDAAGVRLVVEDRGRGMSEEVLASALVPFFTTKQGGSGLGLAICREIVEAHRGRIRLRNRRGGGAEVSVRLPSKTSHASLSWTATRA